MPRVLVTGATGFLGSHAAVALQRAGHDVRILARTPAKVPRALAPLGGNVADVVAGDMTDADAVARALDGCDAVVHCAAEIGVAGGLGPSSAANVVGSRNVLGRAVAAGLDPIIYTSTLGIHLPTEDPVLTVDSPLAAPLSTYAAQKLEVERMVRSLQAEGAPITSFVIGGIYGPVSPHLEGSFTAITAALEMGMVGPPDAGMGIIDVRDLAALIVAAMRPGLGPRRYLATGTYVTWKGWAEVLAEATGKDVRYAPITAEQLIEIGRRFDEQRAKGKTMPPLSEEAAVLMCAGRPGDDSRTLAELGVTYRPLVETFRDTVEWLRASGALGG